jgi:cytochrome c-type biogenesis protein CcmH
MILPPYSNESRNSGKRRTGLRLRPDSRFRGSDALFAFGLFVAAPSSPALADSSMAPAEYAYRQLPDPKQEAKATALMQTLRCLVCQGQSIADSDAEMAGDMRALVRRRIQAGEEPEAIRRWLIERYGNWVSYAPPVEPVTWPLWVAPLLLLGLGVLLARGRFRRKRR